MASQIARRKFLATLGGAAASRPLAARAQQSTLPVIGFLNGASAWEYSRFAAACRLGLSETGYIEGRNVLVEYRWAEGHYERLPTLAADLVRRQVAVIVANSSAAVAAKAATTTIPIVFTTAGDPVKLGFVASLNRPGGNLTGATTISSEVGAKRMELLHELAPAATAVAVLVNPTSPIAKDLSTDMQVAAEALGMQVHILHASSERDFDAVFATLVQLRLGGLVIGSDSFFTSRSEQLAALALRHAVPAIYQYREFAAAGGLLSYGANAADNYRLVGIYAGRILKGEMPADLPVQQSTKIEFFINLKTAKTLGLTVPDKLLVAADEVIE